MRAPFCLYIFYGNVNHFGIKKYLFPIFMIGYLPPLNQILFTITGRCPSVINQSRDVVIWGWCISGTKPNHRNWSRDIYRSKQVDFRSTWSCPYIDITQRSLWIVAQLTLLTWNKSYAMVTICTKGSQYVVRSPDQPPPPLSFPVRPRGTN